MNKSRFPVRTPFRFRKDYGKIKTTCKLCAETACREVERRDGIGGCPDRGAVLGAGRGGHCGEQRQVRRLLLPDRLPHPGPAGGRGGVRGRHLAAGLGGHAAQPPRQAGYVPGEDHPEPVPGPLAGPAGPEAVAGTGGTGADGAGGLPARLRRRGTGGGGRRPGGEPEPLLESLPQEKRVLFVRRYWYLCSVEELAAWSGRRRGTVSAALFRLRQDLREHLEREGFTL